MLHILLLILKIIGIILAAILGILVLLVCIVLFTPLKYRAKAASDGTLDGIKADFACTWFFHLVSIQVCLRGKKVKYRARILWKKLIGGEEDKKSDEIKGDGEYEEKADKPDEKQGQTDEGGSKGSKSTEEGTQKEPGLHQGAEKEREEASQSHGEKPEEERTAKEIHGSTEKTGRVEAFLQKCKAFAEKIKCTFAGICDRIKTLLDMKETLTEFIEDENHRTAFAKLKKELLRLIKKLKPGTFKADIRFGLEDPCSTGQVLAVAGVLYPFIGEHMVIQPDFGHRVLEGELLVRGKIRACSFAVLAVRLLLSKAVRVSYKDIRNFQKR